MSVEPEKSLLLMTGSTREGSVNTAVLKTARTTLPHHWTALAYSGLTQLPHFNPDVERSVPPPPVRNLRAAIRASDAILFCTPEYAGAMPGALKNLLEWTIGDTVMYGKPVGWINPSTAPQRAAGTYASLKTVLSYTGATIVDDACLNIPVNRALIGETGTDEDLGVQERIRAGVLALTSCTH
ncbi:NADPH-dependent FMN reductase [Nesterenkonia haasae]|uniref:NADPH-dependent FMN reductase n=1 Tax=Nesterenkonia haasae TaxID=2587813 RepID=UPI001390E05B|nr:NADPH-dependent FMN reductase [Nesterenkonia haasae]NDK33212.1 NAD(P)H-dependent oxidoreductase [Nesterenkonia haasae]